MDIMQDRKFVPKRCLEVEKKEVNKFDISNTHFINFEELTKEINEISLVNGPENKIKINTDLLPIKKDYLWQNIIKDLFKIDESINLDDYISNINLDFPFNSYNIFFNYKKAEICKEKLSFDNLKNKLNIINKKILSIWDKMEKKEKEPFERIRKEKSEEYKAQITIMKNFFY